MADSIEIHPDLVSGLVPILTSRAAIEEQHVIAERGNAFFRFAHGYFLESLGKYTDYDPEVIKAISSGVRSYEILGVSTGAVIPAVYGLLIVSNIEKNPNYGVNIAEAMEESVQALVTERADLARGFKKLGQVQLRDPAADSNPAEHLLDYSVRGAALMRSAHQDAHQMWQFELDVLTENEF